MIILAPNTNIQSFNVIPRDPTAVYNNNLSLTNYIQRISDEQGTFEGSQCLTDYISDINDLTLTISDETTKVAYTYQYVYAESKENYLTIKLAFVSNGVSILKENRLYKLIITRGGNNWWRGKARCTSQTDFQEKFSLNTIASTQYLVLEDDETFTILP